MTDWLRGIRENLEQPLDALQISGSETALEITVIGEDQGCECGNVGSSERGPVADRVTVRGLAGSDRNARRAEVELGPATGKRRYEEPAGERDGCRRLCRLRTVFREASRLSDHTNRHDVRGASRKQHRSCGISGRHDQIAAIGIGRKPADMQLAVRRVTAYAVRCLGRRTDKARAWRAVADCVLRP